MSNYKRFYNNSYKYIFITIVTHNRNEFLIQNIDTLRKSFIYAKTKDWKYSTFLKFVKNNYYDINWCNFEDKNEIVKLDFE